LARRALERAERGGEPGESHSRADARLLAPLPRPLQMRDFLCFEGHLQNALDRQLAAALAGAPDPEAKRRELLATGRFSIPRVWYDIPLYYTCNPLAVIGPDADVRWPDYAAILDYELEFAAVIGRRATDVPRERALAHVFGYTIFNDVSARDEQMKEMPGSLGPGKGKDFDGANVLGPCIATADELDPYDLAMTARVNGVEWSRGHSSQMHPTHRFEDCIARVTRSGTLHPGELICSGTVPTGCGIELGRFPQPGDVIELEVERIGVLRNRFVKRS
jgi:2-keto-4-pentenoate hydratase/2-oxohepta-3-ene-1,7-dioic acid hydratase in catechol pathway